MLPSCELWKKNILGVEGKFSNTRKFNIKAESLKVGKKTKQKHFFSRSWCGKVCKFWICIHFPSYTFMTRFDYTFECLIEKNRKILSKLGFREKRKKENRGWKSMNQRKVNSWDLIWQENVSFLSSSSPMKCQVTSRRPKFSS